MALWSWLKDRACGVFLHVSSLPSDQGIGCFGAQAFDFINFLKKSGMKYWQICPLNPTSFGDSPYQSPSSFAGNPYFISLDMLVEMNLLEEHTLDELRKIPNNDIDYGALYRLFQAILEQAYNNFCKQNDLQQQFQKFCQSAGWWLDNHAKFMALKEKFPGKIWTDWPKEFRDPNTAKVDQDRINFHKFVQWIWNDQWKILKSFANKNGISIIGDLPIFVGFDSADVWANKEIFQLRSDGSPKVIAGVPPDAFSSTGQLWGNPLYDCEVLKRTDFSWWMNRLRRCLELYDVIRLDHFRGFCDFWEVPAGDETAKNGHWAQSVGIKFFESVKLFPHIKFIAEDLGDLNENVVELLNDTGLPGMAVLQFAFDGNCKNKYLPHEHDKNQVLYLGTLDNDTTNGWFEHLPENNKEQVRQYFMDEVSDVAWTFIKKSFPSPAKLLILSMQDILNLGTEARLNTPNTIGKNWRWRIKNDDFYGLINGQVPNYLHYLCKIYGR